MLTPVDIENKEFTKAFRGYDIYEVEEFMRSLVKDYEKLYRDNAEMKEKVAVLTETIGSYKGMEETMQNAILVAQRTAEDIKQNAYDRAETIIKEAERKAAEAVNNANNTISNLEKTYLSMQREMNGFKAKMSALLSTYMQLLSDLPERASSFSSVNVPQPASEEKKPGTAPVSEDTHRFTLPTRETEEVAAPVAVETPVQTKEPAAVETAAQPKTAETGFETERKVNPVIEELMQKNREQNQTAPEAAKPEESFSVVKETVDKESDPRVASINLADLESFDVFSDDSI